MFSNRSRGTLMSYTDHSAQRRFKSNTHIVLGKGPCSVARLHHHLAPPKKNPDHEICENLFNGLTQQLSTI